MENMAYNKPFEFLASNAGLRLFANLTISTVQ